MNNGRRLAVEFRKVPLHSEVLFTPSESTEMINILLLSQVKCDIKRLRSIFDSKLIIL
jgi:hypothetical protein